MFQELLLADLVVADLSIDNANAFYELGVRHAMRKRGVIHIQSGRAYLPFDIFNVRTIPYHCGTNGKPDPKHLAQDIQTIAKVAQDTWASDRDRVHSPIFNLLDGLEEPNRQALRTPLATAYWQEYKAWQERVQIAERKNYIGDVLLLTEEVRNPLIREEAILEAGKILRDLEHHTLALKQYRQGLQINPRNLEFRRQEAFELGRLKRHEEAIVKLERLLEENPTDSEAVAFLGRLYKDMWQERWQDVEDSRARLKAAYEAAHLLKRAIGMYLTGFGMDQSHHYSGINALNLSLVLDHLAQAVGPSDRPDPETEAIRQQIPMLSGAVEFSLDQAVKSDTNNFWTHASLGDIAVSTAEDPRAVAWAYRKALALSGSSMYAVQSILAQLRLLEALAFRPEHVKAGLTVLEDAFGRLYEVEEKETTQPDQDPAQVFLCSGHMIDRADRPEPRFPPEMEAEAQKRIEQALDTFEAGSRDMLITAGAACGGDILFIEACLRREMAVEVYLPFPEATFIEESVSFAGNNWVERFYKIRRHPNVTFHLQPDRVGPVPRGDNPFARNNRWALNSTLCYGIDRVHLLVLWNGKGGDGPGGTAHMVEEVRQLGGIVKHLNTTKFDYWQEQGNLSDNA
jgi:tetratricopeptide (TPR) repeat protein